MNKGVVRAFMRYAVWVVVAPEASRAPLSTPPLARSSLDKYAVLVWRTITTESDRSINSLAPRKGYSDDGEPNSQRIDKNQPRFFEMAPGSFRASNGRLTYGVGIAVV